MAGYGGDSNTRNLSETVKVQMSHTISEEASNFLKCSASALRLSEDETLDAFIRMASSAIAMIGSRPRRPVDDVLVSAPEQFQQALAAWFDRTA